MKTQKDFGGVWRMCQGYAAIIITLALAGSIAWAGKPPKPSPESGYRMVALGTGEARKINDAGWVVGDIYSTTYGYGAFVLIPQDTDADGDPDTWYAGENGVNELVIDLGTLGGRETYAFGINDYLINDDGDIVDDLVRIVGCSKVGDDGPQGPSPTHAVLWQVNPQTHEVETIDLGKLGDNVLNTVAWSINNHGQVVGYTCISGENHAFLINPLDTDGDEIPDTWYAGENDVNELMIDLGIADSCAPVDINDSGEIVGTSGGYGFLIRPADSDGDGKPDTWFTGVDGINPLMVPLPPSSGASGSFAMAINNDGLIVGSSDADVVLWHVESPEAVSETLTHIKGYEKTVPRDLNEEGVIVGDAYSWHGGVNALTGGKPKFEACLSDCGVMIKLANRVVDWGTWEASQSEAFGINGRGEIVGGSWVVGGFIAIPVR